jgi:hypothetical protein
MSYELQRVFIGFSREANEDELYSVSQEEFLRGRNRRFGNANSEPMQEPFWEGMIRSGVSGYRGNKLFDGEPSVNGTPVWCAQRLGQSMTILPDGRIVQIGGEHEDFYDPDFCIYNDVIVHEVDGTLRISM